MDRNNNSLSGRTFFLLQEWRKMALLMEIRLQKKEERKVMLVTTTLKIEKKNVDFSRILSIKTDAVFCYFKTK